jgi:tetratricopeptide (TPR) repeat protein
VYAAAKRLGPDETGHLMIKLNQGVLALHRGHTDVAVATFQEVLAESKSGYLGVKSQAACHYNLGVAYQRQGQDAQAVLAFNAVLDTWPATEYARYARIALERRKQKGKTD